MIYNKRLINLREMNNIKQKDIAKYLDIERGVYSIFETENKIMPIKHLIKISLFFNVSIDYLFNLTDIKNYENSCNADINKSVKRLKEFRKNFKLTQTDLAKILNIANGTIANYETGRNFIATAFLYEICKKYNISADYLLGKIDKPIYLK